MLGGNENLYGTVEVLSGIGCYASCDIAQYGQGLQKSRSSGKKEVTVEKKSTKEKTGSKPAGTGAHNKKIIEVADNVKDGEIIAGGGRLNEKLIATPGGLKSGRRPDILVKQPDGSIYGINVRKTTASGLPITREIQPINDLEIYGGIKMYFVPYDK